MNHKRHSLAIDRFGRPIEIGTFCWSSAETPWTGFPIETRVLQPGGRLAQFGVEHDFVGLCVNGVGEMRVGSGHNATRITSSPGRFTLLGQGYEQKPVSWSGRREMVFVSLDAHGVGRYLRDQEDYARRSLEPRYGIPDSQLANLVVNMRAEAQTGCYGGKAYAEALSIALATYLLGRYSRQRAPVANNRLTLSNADFRRVRDYIEANLARNMGVVELADLVGLSPHHFSTLFKNAFGASPHRYILSKRIDEARRRLATCPVPLADLALDLGFSDQSHFARVFRRFTGTTPKLFRNQC